MNCNFLKSFVTLYTENTKPLMCTNFPCQYQCVFIVQSHLSLVHKMTQWYSSKRSWIYESCVPTISILNLNLALKEVTVTKSTIVNFFKLSVIFYFFSCCYTCDILRRSGNITLLFDAAAIVNVETS